MAQQQQYQPRMDGTLAVPTSARGSGSETESGATHTARELLSDKETAPVRLEDMQDAFGPQNLNHRTSDSVAQ